MLMFLRLLRQAHKQSMSSTGEHCRHLERHLLPAAHRCMEKMKTKLVELRENYFDSFNASPDASAATASDDKY